MAKKRSKREIVGYGKPPSGTQFKKGQSGNPTGRRRGSKNLMTHLSETLAEKVSVREGEKVRIMPKAKVVAVKLVNSAMSGELPAIRKVMELSPEIEKQKAAVSSVPDEDLSPEELDMLEAYLKRRKGQE